MHGYHAPQLKNIAIPAVAFSPYNFTILPTCQLNFFCVSNPIWFCLEKGRNYVSTITIITSNITLLMSHNVIWFRCFMPVSHGVNKKAPLPLPLTRFSLGLFITFINLLVWSDCFKKYIFKVKQIFSFKLLLAGLILMFFCMCVS